MQGDLFCGRRFTPQLFRYSLAFGTEGGRSRTENGWIAVPFCDRIHQSFDFSIQLRELLFETLPLCIRCDREAFSLFEVSTHVLRNDFRRTQLGLQPCENSALNRVKIEGLCVRARAVLRRC
ncbi:hypothetical protein AAV28_32560 [Bradyrhizobium diazoefficiens USDA 110]|nr:hypothetical protein AAV28_32560 [Bradyrhizobium diazoefficiens USDA 110]